MTHPVCRTCGEPVLPGQPRYGPASLGDEAEHWDCHKDVPELLAELRGAMTLHLGPDEVHGDPLPRRTDDE